LVWVFIQLFLIYSKLVISVLILRLYVILRPFFRLVLKIIVNFSQVINRLSSSLLQVSSFLHHQVFLSNPFPFIRILVKLLAIPEFLVQIFPIFN